MGNGTEDSTSNIESLADQIASLTKAVQRLDKPKDRWDKLAAISALLSGVFIGAAGIVATSLYNSKQLKLQDGQERSRQILQKAEQDARLHVSVVEVVEKYFPHLTSDKPTDRRIALGSIAVMDPNLATRLTLYMNDPGLAEMLKQVYQSSSPQLSADASGVFRILANVTLQNQITDGKPCSIRLSAPAGVDCTPEAGGLARDATYTFRFDNKGGVPQFTATGPVCQEARSATWTTTAGDPTKGTLSIGYKEALFSFDASGNMTGLGQYVKGWSGVVYCAP